jgi:hypothetical protein
MKEDVDGTDCKLDSQFEYNNLFLVRVNYRTSKIPVDVTVNG